MRCHSAAPAPHARRLLPLLQDDRIAVAALWKPPLLAALWPAPAWLLEAQPSPLAALATTDAVDGSSESDNSSESEGTSDSTSSESRNKESGSSSEASISEDELPPQPQGGSATGMFDALDRLFMGGSGSRHLALEQLKQATAAAAAGAGGGAGGSGNGPSAQHRASLVAAAAPQPTAAANAAAAAKAAAASAAPGRRRQPTVAAADAGAGEAENVAVIGGKRFQRLSSQAAGINVWLCQKVATKSAAALPLAQQPLLPPPPQPPQLPPQLAAHQQAGQQAQQQEQMLGYVCHIKATDQLLLLTNLHSPAAAAQLQQHPVLQMLLKQRERVAAVLHLAAPGVAGSWAMRALCQQLRPAVAGAAAGQQLLLEGPGAHSSQVGVLQGL